MKIFNEVFQRKLLSKNVVTARRLLAGVMVPVVAFSMTGMNFAVVGLMTVYAEDTTVLDAVVVNSMSAVEVPKADPTPAVETKAETPTLVVPAVGTPKPVETAVSTPAVEPVPAVPAVASVPVPEPISTVNLLSDPSVVPVQDADPILTLPTKPAMEAPDTASIRKTIPEWVASGKRQVTGSLVVPGTQYVAPQNDQVTIVFTKLPENAGMLSIEEITLTDEQVAILHALSNKAYDITSDMADGTFSYTMTLPKPKDRKNVHIKFAEDISGLENADTVPSAVVKTKTDSVSATLDHFTIYAVTGSELTIAAPSLTISKPYDADTGATVTAGVLIGVDEDDKSNVTVEAVANYDTKNVGTGKTVTVVYTLGGSAALHYIKPVDFAVTTGVITSKHITGSFTASNKTYDGTTVASYPNNRTLDGLEQGDQLFLSGGTALFSDSAVGNGKTVTLTGVTLGGASVNNYTLDSVTATANITTAISVTTVTCPTGVTYTGFARTPCTVAVTGVDNLYLTPDATYASNTLVGTASASYVYGGDTDHSSSSGTTSFSIEKADAKVVIAPYSVTYDGNAHTATGTATGIESTPVDLSGLLTCTGSIHFAVGEYATDMWRFAGNGNYKTADGTVHDTITKARAICTVTGYSVPYDDADHTASGSCIGAKGETLSGLDLSGTTRKKATAPTYDRWTFTDETGNYADASGTVKDTITDRIEEDFNEISATVATMGIANNLNDVTTDTVVGFSGLRFETSVDGHALGRVTFNTPLNLSDDATKTFLRELGTHLGMSAGSIRFDATFATQLKNAGAEIRIYGLNALGYTGVTPIIVRDDADTILSLGNPNYPRITDVLYDVADNGTLTFKTTHFTRFNVPDHNQTMPDGFGEAILFGGITQVVLIDPNKAVTVGVTDGMTDPSVDVSAFVDASGVGILPRITVNSGIADVVIPGGTKVTGPTGWNGVISAPTSGMASGGKSPAGFFVGSTVITLGSPEGTISFDRPVAITLPGVVGAVGYRPSGSDWWTEITNACTGTYENPTGAPKGGECSIDNGTDTKILTYHFTSFGSLIDRRAPDAVTDLTAKSSVNRGGTVEVGWHVRDASTDKVFIYRGTTGHSTMNRSSLSARQDRTDDIYVDRFVKEGGTYYYTVVAEDASGNRSDAKVIKIVIPTYGRVATGVAVGSEPAPIQEDGDSVVREDIVAGAGSGMISNTVVVGDTVATDDMVSGTDNESTGTGGKKDGAVLGMEIETDGFLYSDRMWIIVIAIGGGVFAFLARRRDDGVV